MSRDFVPVDKWLVLGFLGVAGVFAMHKLTGGRIDEVLYALDRTLYSLL